MRPTERITRTYLENNFRTRDFNLLVHTHICIRAFLRMIRIAAGLGTVGIRVFIRSYRAR